MAEAAVSLGPRAHKHPSAGQHDWPTSRDACLWAGLHPRRHRAGWLQGGGVGRVAQQALQV